MGRWVNRDPLYEGGNIRLRLAGQHYDFGQIDGVNSYAYVFSNPINMVDPKGLETSEFGGGLAGLGGPNTGVAGGMGFEGHLLWGGGIDTFYCCDGKYQWVVRTYKTCKGMSAVISGGGTLANINSSGVDCPDGFAGEYIEWGFGPIEVTIPPEGSSGLAAGLTAGLGFKFTICKYEIHNKEVIGCCDK